MSQPLSIKIDGLDDLIKDVHKAGRDARPLIRAALQNSASRVQGNVRRKAPHRTGALQRSVLTTINYPSARVTVQESYGRYVEEGTKPHIITPVNKKALFWKGAANPYRSVRHPGTKPRPFFGPGVEESILYVHEQFNKVAERLVKTMAGRT